MTPPYSLDAANALLDFFENLRDFAKARVCQLVQAVPYTSNVHYRDKNGGCGACLRTPVRNMELDDLKIIKIPEASEYVVCAEFRENTLGAHYSLLAEEFHIEIGISTVVLPESEWDAFVQSEQARFSYPESQQ